MVRIAGRKDAPGRPFLYETTREFLVAFGLRDLGDLPRVDGELVLPEVEVRGAAEGEPSETNPEQEPSGTAEPERAAEGEPSENPQQEPSGTTEPERAAAGDADATEQGPGARGPDQPAGG
jgi:segregation and condensation protein B